MGNRINTVIFDLDGTLLDTIGGITDSVNAALRRWDCPLRTVAEVRDFVGNGLRRTLALAIPGGETFPDFEAALAYLIQHYEQHCLENSPPYPGVQALLSELKAEGYKLAIVSNKTDPAVQTLCRRYFAGSVDCAIGEKPSNRRKPAPDAVLEAMARLGASPSSTVYVGDSEVDLLTAENSGIPCISVLWGFRDKPRLLEAGAKHFAAHAAQIPELIKELELCAE